MDDFKRSEVEADGAASFFGGFEHAHHECFIEEQVAFDMCVVATSKVSCGYFFGCERHGGAEVGAHGAFAVGGDEGDALTVGLIADLEARAVAAELSKLLAIEL